VFSGPQATKGSLVNGKQVINLATSNFIGLLSNTHIKDEALKALRYYGVGTCGPCGFYGTFDVHMQLEKRIAELLGTEQAIVYAQAFSAVASIVPAFAKRGDIIVCDEGIRFALQRGVQISRSTIKYYKHNDMDDLERVLKDVYERDQRKGGKVTRRFILTEGLSEYYGDVCPLPKMVELKTKYKYRIMLDDSMAFGILGARGGGTTEHFGVGGSEVDIIMGSLANALCSSGGFCAGSVEIVDHQRLGSNAYVFSASLPAMLAVCALRGLDVLEQSKENGVLRELRDNIATFKRVFLDGWQDSKASQWFDLVGDVHSPTQYIRINKAKSAGREVDELLVQRMVDALLEAGIVVVNTHYVLDFERSAPLAAAKIMLTNELTSSEMQQVAESCRQAVNDVVMTL
jgi:serine palmitoyltransferase